MSSKGKAKLVYFAKFNHSSVFDEVRHVASVLFNEMDNLGLINRQGKDLIYECVLKILCELYVAYKGHNGAWLVYYRRKEEYINLPLSYTHTIRVINFLDSQSYIENILGNKAQGLSSKMRMRDKLSSLFKISKAIIEMVHPDPSNEIVEVKTPSNKVWENGTMVEKGKELIRNYPEIDEMKRIRSNLHNLNLLLMSCPISLGVTNKELRNISLRLSYPLNFNMKQLKRIFNEGDLEHGGRYYGGWWQNIPKQYRENILIDGVPVCELDFTGLHINMLYAMKGLPEYTGQVYKIPGYMCDKDFIKKCIQALINSKNPKGAKTKIYQDIKYGEIPFPKGLSNGEYKTIENLMNAILTKHSPIRDLFKDKVGRKLQRIDSNIAEDVIKYFVNKSIPILPEHDSFLVQYHYQSVLRDIMLSSYRKHMYGFDISIKNNFKVQPQPNISGQAYSEVCNYTENYKRLYAPLKLNCSSLFEFNYRFTPFYESLSMTGTDG